MINDLQQLSPTDFENLVYDLAVVLGLENATWRTPGRDGGRDIEGYFTVGDLSGYRQLQKWYIECKKYESAVDWPTVRQKLAYAETHSADFLLMVTTSSLSPQAVDEINLWNSKYVIPRIRFWNGHEVMRRMMMHSVIAAKYCFLNPDDGSGLSALGGLAVLSLKFTQAAYNSAVFSGHESATLEAATALADLSLSRLEHLEKKLKWYPEPFRVEDLYDWVSFKDFETAARFDRHGLRAFLSVLQTMMHYKPLTIASNSTGLLLPMTTTLSAGQMRDLQHLALVADCELKLEEQTIVLIRRKYDATE